MKTHLICRRHLEDSRRTHLAFLHSKSMLVTIQNEKCFQVRLASNMLKLKVSGNSTVLALLHSEAKSRFTLKFDPLINISLYEAPYLLIKKDNR
ncbi:hypothetical protein X975_04757, partial [Stegodyphus mimosarum]